MSASKPNILVIMSDQHKADVMGCAGDAVVATPNLDRLAERGALLTDLYCPSPLCAPSRMSFMTGMLPSQTGVTTNDQIPNPAHPTIAHAAGAAGYRPFLSGKLHAMGPDQLLGFVDRVVADHGPNYSGGRRPDRGVLAGGAGPHLDSLRKIGPGRNPYQVKDEYVAEAVVSYLTRHDIEQRATGDEQPFFLKVGFMLPHQPFVARREDYERYEGRVPPPVIPGATTEVDDHPFLRWWREATGIAPGIPEETVTRARTAYWAMVDRMDRIIGTILDTLDRLGMAENTIVVYTSDHGEQVGEHGLWWKTTLMESAVRIPGIISWPGVIPAGTRCERVASLVDINATLVDAMGAPALPRSVGRSMLGMLGGTETDWDDVAISEYSADRKHYSSLGRMDVPEGHYQRMIRSGRYKYVDYGNLSPHLIDLVDDPHETRNRADDPALAGVRATLAAQARDGWDPNQVMAETRTSLDELDVIRQWYSVVEPEDRYRFELSARYAALDEPLSPVPEPDGDQDVASPAVAEQMGSQA